MKNTATYINQTLTIAIAVVAAFASLAVVITAHVSAAPLTSTYLRPMRMDDTLATPMRLVFKPGTAAATSIAINLNGADTTTWTGSGGLVNATQTVSSASCVAETPGATALPGTLAASGSGSTITITGATTLSTSATYCVDLTSASAVTNPSAGEYHPTIVTTAGDSATVALRIIANDQVVINATVPPSFNFVLSAGTDNFTTALAAGSVATTTGITATVNTNAPGGWTAWVRSASPGLSSIAASKTINATTPGTSATLVAGTEGYVTGITAIAQGSGAGVTSAVAAYNAQSTAHGSGADTTFRQIANSTGTASSAVITLKERAAISALTPAASDYTDTLTVVAAAKF